MQLTEKQINEAIVEAFKRRLKSTCGELERSILREFVNTIFDKFYIPNSFIITHPCKSNRECFFSKEDLAEDSSNVINCIIQTITKLFNSVGLDVSVSEYGWTHRAKAGTFDEVFVTFKI